MFSSSYIHFDVPIKGGFSQECQPFLLEIGAVEQFSIGGASIDQECPSGILPIQLRLWGICHLGSGTSPIVEDLVVEQ